MKIDAVPQETSPTYGGQRKLMYAVDDRGEYQGVGCAGWDVESAATLAAVAEINRLRDIAWQRAVSGVASPLEFYMHRQRMDIPLLASASGIWQWRVRRHFNARRFASLSQRVLLRYAEALGISATALQQLPSQPDL